ncbi:MAG: hypothetical protein P8M17_11355 [Saprospiraceae bacterium]|nr:hypothetical protein [bacterium]MDG2419581.1 hypothetical protein [Saprospiraceae bacterium]
MIPSSFEEWKNCIVNDCNIKLTEEFTKKRLSIYEDSNHPETKNFEKLYGKQHLNNIIYWLKKYVDK